MIYELYAGEGKAAVSTASPAVNSAYNAMMMIIVFGWAIYPARICCWLPNGWRVDSS